MRHLYDEAHSHRNCIGYNFGEFWGTLRVMPFFGKAHLAAAERRRVRY